MQRFLRPRLEMPRLGLPAFRQRILVRGVFLLLALATVVGGIDCAETNGTTRPEPSARRWRC